MVVSKKQPESRKQRILRRQKEQELRARTRVADKFERREDLMDVEKEAIREWVKTGKDQDFLPHYYRTVNWRHQFFNY